MCSQHVRHIPRVAVCFFQELYNLNSPNTERINIPALAPALITYYTLFHEKSYLLRTHFTHTAPDRASLGFHTRKTSVRAAALFPIQLTSPYLLFCPSSAYVSSCPVSFLPSESRKFGHVELVYCFTGI